MPQLRAECFNGQHVRGLRKLVFTTLRLLCRFTIQCQRRDQEDVSLENQMSHRYRRRGPIGSTETNEALAHEVRCDLIGIDNLVGHASWRAIRDCREAPAFHLGHWGPAVGRYTQGTRDPDDVC